MLSRPFRFAPYLKSVLWGGDKIAKYKEIETEIENIGESWELSAMSGHESVVVDDEENEGITLNQLIDKYGEELLGTDVVKRYGKTFPLLVKIIDARSNLSVQVHPNDELAMRRHNCKGKTEMWYIISAEPGSYIYTGLSAALTPDEYTRRIADNTIMQVVGRHKSAPDQFYFVPSGTLHAIGAGNLLAEIQESCDITYRVYDYGRLDADGKPRELHTLQAKEAINYAFPNHITPTAKIFTESTEGAVKSEFFKVDYIKMTQGKSLTIDNKGKTFAILMVTAGEFTLTMTDGTEMKCSKGTTLLIPASVACTVTGEGKGLLTTL